MSTLHNFSFCFSLFFSCPNTYPMGEGGAAKVPSPRERGVE